MMTANEARVLASRVVESSLSPTYEYIKKAADNGEFECKYAGILVESEVKYLEDRGFTVVKFEYIDCYTISWK
jgi:hypothetical protein